MNEIYLFSATSRLAGWLSTRQAAVSENIANVNTPGYRAGEIEPFSDVLDATQLRLAATRSGHIGFTESAQAPPEWSVNRVASPVGIEQQLIAADEINRSYALHSSVAKAFHRMILMSVKG